MNKTAIIILVLIAIVIAVVAVIAIYLLNRTKYLRDFAKQSKEATKQLEAENALKEAKAQIRIEKSQTEAMKIITALGGKENITSISQCAIRIRVQLTNYNLADEKALKNAGVEGIIKTGRSWQLIIGDRAEEIYNNIQKDQ